MARTSPALLLIPILALAGFSAASGADAVQSDGPSQSEGVRDGPYRFYFWIKPEFYGTAIAEQGEGHPCGGISAMEVSTIPEFPDEGPYQPFRAFEYGENGDVVREWRLPVDSQVYAIDGDSLLAQPQNYWETQSYFWFGTDGDVSRISLADEPEHPSWSQCPAFVEEWYACAEISDQTDGLPHNVAIETICT